MKDSPNHIRYSARDRQPLGIEDLSKLARVSSSFIRLCIESGCPAPGQLLSL